jgi:chromosome partitioning protein
VSAKVIAICNQKGGVGKTTTTFQLARAAVLAGRRVLLVDMDPQGNLTSSAYAPEAVDDPTDLAGVADLLQTPGRGVEVPATRAVILSTSWPGCDLVGTFSTGALSLVRDQLVVAQHDREHRLRKALVPVVEDYDVVLIDCPPSLDNLTINAFVAADAVVIVSETSMYSATGLMNLIETLNLVREYTNPGIQIAGLLINGHDARQLQAAQWKQTLTATAAELGIAVLTPPMPHRVVIKDATEAGLGVDEWPGSPDAVSVVAPIYQRYLRQIEGVLA